MKNALPYSLIICFFFIKLNTHAQTYSLDQFNKKEPFSTSGGINFTQIYYNSLGGEQRRLPYTYNLNGSVTANVFGFSFPFSFNLSNQQSRFRQPFNQIKIEPKYKWVRLHVGNSNMSWSPLTLAGHNFNGFGVELTPKKFKLSVMYGTLLQPVAIDTTNPNNQAAYKRIGYGINFGKQLGKGNYNIILFGAHDDVSSIPFIEGYDALKPKSNIVASFHGVQPITKKLHADVEIATSYLTENNTIENNQGAKFPLLSSAGNATSSFYTAIKSNLTYQFKQASLGIGYERIAPQYRTLGAYFFNNNLENITLNTNTSLFKQKVQLTANVGLQRDDLDKSQINTMKRFVSSINLAYAVNKKLNLSGSYSNFLSYSYIKPQIDQINPLLPNQQLSEQDFTQLSHNSNLNVSYLIKSKKDKSQNLNINLTQQIATSDQSGQVQNSGTQFYNANVAYSFKTKKIGAISITTNGNLNKTQQFNTISLAPGINYSKSIKEKLQITLGSSFSQFFQGNSITKSVSNYRINLAYTLKKSHQFSLNGIYLNSKPFSNIQQKINELTITLTYGYRFSYRPSTSKD